MQPQQTLTTITCDLLEKIQSQCHMVVTDSGGLQEEDPAFGVPVLVLRSETERPEVEKAGTVLVVGVEKENILVEAVALLTIKDKYNAMSKVIKPYGDSIASQKIVDKLVLFQKMMCSNKCVVFSDRD